MQGEAANATVGLKRSNCSPRTRISSTTYSIKKVIVFYIEGKKGEQGKEWGATQTPQDYVGL